MAGVTKRCTLPRPPFVMSGFKRQSHLGHLPTDGLRGAPRRVDQRHLAEPRALRERGADAHLALPDVQAHLALDHDVHLVAALALTKDDVMVGMELHLATWTRRRVSQQWIMHVEPDMARGADSGSKVVSRVATEYHVRGEGT